MEKRAQINLPDFLNIDILESLIEKSLNKKVEFSCSIPPPTPLYYSINSMVENYGYDTMKNIFQDTIGKAISFYKKQSTEYIMYHSPKYSFWIFVLKDDKIILTYPRFNQPNRNVYEF
jgi:hypothetical protein